METERRIKGQPNYPHFSEPKIYYIETDSKKLKNYIAAFPNI